MQYFEEARDLWRTYVPRRGQAESVQGELIRAVEKLRDEAQRNGNGNGNGNWDDGFEILAPFLRDTLASPGLFAPPNRRADRPRRRPTAALRHPQTGDEPYHRLTDRVVE
jgi:hypothetical protein